MSAFSTPPFSPSASVDWMKSASIGQGSATTSPFGIGQLPAAPVTGIFGRFHAVAFSPGLSLHISHPCKFDFGHWLHHSFAVMFPYTVRLPSLVVYQKI